MRSPSEKIPRAVWRRKMIAYFVCRRGKERKREREREREREGVRDKEYLCVYVRESV